MKWRAGILLVVAALLAAPALWFAPPVYRYRAACGEYMQHPIQAELRPIFIERLRRRFREDGIPYFMLFGRPYLTWLGSYDSLNWEWRHAFGIADGDGGRVAPPPAVQRLMAEWEREHGERLSWTRDGWFNFDTLRKIDLCALKRAALTYADGD